ncbi:MAG: Ni/Fe hydrogenase subunit alpha [Chloroflexi bacterium]|nr:Ni/Fe hydrogenase subunit alpha [Chloroflexota bacterium]
MSAAAKKPVEERVYEVGELTRVEGEGSLRLRVRDGEVVEARFGIFETPRYFEQLVVGRTPDEVIDIVARICGICPVAYQMSAVHGFEDLFGVRVDPSTRALRRLFYCGEWIESHALHVYFLHAPDFLGYESGIALAADHGPLVEKALRMKKAGNRLVALLGGRPIHPVSVRVGGWSRAPRTAELREHRPALVEALEIARETVDIVAGFTMPAFARESRLVSLRHAAEYPYNDGRIVSSDGIDISPAAWRDVFEEHHVEGSNALHARAVDGRGPYLVGPAARITLAADQLHPLAREALASSGFAEQIRTNVYASIVARAVELVHAVAEAIDIIDAYRPPSEPLVHWQSRPGVAAWATEAPRGLLFHRYEVDEAGRIRSAQIVPPTAQNQAAIERDLVAAAPEAIALPHEAATRRLEQMIRSYDPCISCATHFLDLTIEEA